MGESNLTNSELLAIIIKNGTRKYNCLEIAQNILKLNVNNSNMSDLEFLSNLSLEELKAYEGIGKIKAIQACTEDDRDQNKKELQQHIRMIKRGLILQGIYLKFYIKISSEKNKKNLKQLY